MLPKKKRRKLAEVSSLQHDKAQPSPSRRPESLELLSAIFKFRPNSH